MKIAISAESTIDMPKDLLTSYGISVIPFDFTIDGTTYTDGDLSISELFDLVNKTGKLPKTMAINSFTYKEYFEGLLKEADAVIHIALSGGISSTFNNAKNAASELENVFVVDSFSLSAGIGLLAIYARKLALNGDSPEDIYNKVQERAHKLQVSFVIERLDYLHKGGRCSSIALLGANILKIRPSIVVSTTDGKMASDQKYRGKMDAVVEKYCSDTLKKHNNYDNSVAFITYTTATEEMLNAARTALKNAGFINIYETIAGGTVACHSGEHTLGIFYFDN